MDPLSLLILLAAVGGAYFLFRTLYRRQNSQSRLSEARVNEIRSWYEANVLIAKSPQTDQADLRGLLAMENPHDDMFFARLGVLRSLSQNPALPVELQAAAINRVSHEEAAAELDKSLKTLSRTAGGPRGFVGLTTDI